MLDAPNSNDEKKIEIERDLNRADKFSFKNIPSLESTIDDKQHTPRGQSNPRPNSPKLLHSDASVFRKSKSNFDKKRKVDQLQTIFRRLDKNHDGVCI